MISYAVKYKQTYSFTFFFRIFGKVHHYKLFYDGQHYVSQKRFNTINDLVADGLVS